MEQLVQIIAKISRVPSATIASNMTLRALGLTNSILIWRLQHALEKAYSRKFAMLFPDLTIAEVVDQINVHTSAGDTLAEAPLAVGDVSTISTPWSGSTTLGIGVDLEEVRNLPEVQDYREDAFYQGAFSPRELSHAILQANPKETLCGLFCAKEALKKTHPALVDLRMNEILVSHEKGKPSIRVLPREIDRQFHFQVSISHTPTCAAAVVLAFSR